MKQLSSLAAENAWNAKHEIGTPIEFWPGLRGERGTGKRGSTTSEAFVASQTCPVVFCTNQSGYMALTHVRPLTKKELRDAAA